MKLVHNNNFEIIRFGLAMMVVVLHCYDLLNVPYYDWFARVSNDQVSLPYFIIHGFVIMSGYLVLKSLVRSVSIKQYLWRRFLRIYPPLLLVLLFCALVAGPLLTTLSTGAYFRHPDTWLYTPYSLRIFLVKRTECLPGVFAANPATCAVNGSLWTIWVEEFLYLSLLVIFAIRNQRKLLNPLLLLGWLVLVAANFILAQRYANVSIPFSNTIQWDYFLQLLIDFFSGCLLTAFSWKNMRRNRIIFAICIIAGIIACYANGYAYVGYLLYPVALVAFGNDCIPWLVRFFRFGNPSYGLYIYSYPLQQALIQLFSPTPLQLIAATVPLTLALGFASWHWLEAPLLRLKDRVK